MTPLLTLLLDTHTLFWFLFDLLPITLDHATAVESLPQHHRDSFDRLLVAQAMVEGLPIISVDAVFNAYPITRRW